MVRKDAEPSAGCCDGRELYATAQKRNFHLFLEHEPAASPLLAITLRSVIQCLLNQLAEWSQACDRIINMEID